MAFITSLNVVCSFNKIQITIRDASLTKFDYVDSNATLAYSLAFHVTVTNPIQSIEIYYHRVQVDSSYQTTYFSSATLNLTATPFHQGQQSTVIFPANIQGKKRLALEDEDLKRYNSETSSGVYSIHVKIAFRVSLKYVKIYKSCVHGLKMIDCELKIPLTMSGENGTPFTNGTNFRFRETKCSSVFVC